MRVVVLFAVLIAVYAWFDFENTLAPGSFIVKMTET